MTQPASSPPCPAPPPLVAPLRLPARQTDGHKGDYGRIALIGGSRGMTGAIALSAMAALKTGSGLVSAVVPDRCLESVAAYHPAFMTIPLPDDQQGRFAFSASDQLLQEPSLARICRRSETAHGAIGIGPGMTTGPGSLRLVERCLALTHLPRVLDADAINAISDMNCLDGTGSLGQLVLTPHPGEFARLIGTPAGQRDQQIELAGQLAEQLSCVIVLKGGPTVVVKGSESYTNNTGNPGMATGGSGDVLTGVITSLLGLGLAPWDAARLGVWVHGRAGDLAADAYGQAGMTAVEILEALPAAVREVAADSN